MKRIRQRTDEAIVPAAGAIYLVLWWIGEAGRLSNGVGGIVGGLAPFVLFALAIAVSRRRPVVATALIAGTVVLQLLWEGARFTDTSWPAYIPLLIAVVGIAASVAGAARRVALPVVAASALAVALLITLPAFGGGGWPAIALSQAMFLDGPPPPDAVTTLAVTAVAISLGLTAGAWCAGVALRYAARIRAAREEARVLVAERDAVEDELAALSERELLAQEVHDVMAHSLAVIAAQADGARMWDDAISPTSDRVLTAIAGASRDGLVELRRLLDGVPDGVPDGASDAASGPGRRRRPGVADVPALLERVRAAGLEIDFAEFGDACPLSPLGDLSVHRIVQEALTNAVRHGSAGAATTVTLDWRGPGLAALISTPTGAASDGTPGRGIRGMQDRARIAGGWLTAGAEEGAFIVSAFIPVAAPALAFDAAESAE